MDLSLECDFSYTILRGSLGVCDEGDAWYTSLSNSLTSIEIRGCEDRDTDGDEDAADLVELLREDWEVGGVLNISTNSSVSFSAIFLLPKVFLNFLKLYLILQLIYRQLA